MSEGRARLPIQDHPCAFVISGRRWCCTTRRRNAHGIAEYELLYPWHPWAGCLVHIHEVVEKAGREVFRCSLSGRASARWLEIPAWMFDRAAGAAWRVGAAPYVDIAVLNPAGSHNHPARDPRWLASGRLSLLLALEVAPTGRATADRRGAARIDPADEHGKSALGRATHPRRTAQARVRDRTVERRQVYGQAIS